MTVRFPGKPITDRMRNLPIHAKEKHVLNMIWYRVKSEKTSFPRSPAMLERTRKNSELNHLAGEVTEVYHYIPFLSEENLRNQSNTAEYE